MDGASSESPFAFSTRTGSATGRGSLTRMVSPPRIDIRAGSFEWHPPAATSTNPSITGPRIDIPVLSLVIASVPRSEIEIYARLLLRIDPAREIESNQAVEE